MPGIKNFISSDFKNLVENGKIFYVYLWGFIIFTVVYCTLYLGHKLCKLGARNIPFIVQCC